MVRSWVLLFTAVCTLLIAVPNFVLGSERGVMSTDEYAFSDTGSPIHVDSCQDIGSPGEYRLSSDVYASGTCFTINTSDVHLDCEGNTIRYGDGTVGYGILIWSQSDTVTNVSIGNCRIIQESPDVCSADNPCPAIFGFGNSKQVTSNIFSVSEPGSEVFHVTDVSLVDVNISTTSNNSYGIQTAYARSWNISNVKVNTSGSGSHGSYIQISHNLLLIDSSIHTAGDGSMGLFVSSASKNISVNRAEIVTLGDSSEGYSSYLSHYLDLQNSTILTVGDHSEGINTIDSWLTMHNVSISTFGNYSVAAYGSGDLENVTMTTSGDFSGGILARGRWIIDDTMIHTSGESSSGITSSDRNGGVNLSRSSIVTTGNASSGFIGDSMFSLHLNEVTVRTIGDYSPGLTASYLRHACSLNTVGIETLGNDSEGLYLHIAPYLTGSQRCVILDSTINSASSNDMDLAIISRSGNVRIINTTFDHHKTSYFDSKYLAEDYRYGTEEFRREEFQYGMVDVGYWADVYVNDMMGDPVRNAKLSWISVNPGSISFGWRNASTDEAGHARVPSLVYSHHGENLMPTWFQMIIVDASSGFFDVLLLPSASENRTIEHIFGYGLATIFGGIAASVILLVLMGFAATRLLNR